uniref:COMM domain-containing protein n=1 Tax=Angiostrongylus cantonensis TaxID=6313 RepID=A0A0K0D0K0_ANGCA
MVGVVCEKGKSKNSFVPNELCSFNLCDLWSMCNLLRVKTTTAIDIKSLIKQEYLYSDSIPSPYVSGEWKVSIDLIQGQNVLGSLQIGKLTEWLTVEVCQVLTSIVIEKLSAFVKKPAHFEAVLT